MILKDISYYMVFFLCADVSGNTSHFYVQRTLDDFYDQIIFIFVIFILLRALLGSFGLQWFGPKLLT